MLPWPCEYCFRLETSWTSPFSLKGLVRYWLSHVLQRSFSVSFKPVSWAQDHEPDLPNRDFPVNMVSCSMSLLWPSEVDCGSPPTLPHSHMLWNKSTRMGSKVLYQCNSGYHNVGKGNVSICNAGGQWERPPVLCQGTTTVQIVFCLILFFF